MGIIENTSKNLISVLLSCFSSVISWFPYKFDGILNGGTLIILISLLLVSNPNVRFPKFGPCFSLKYNVLVQFILCLYCLLVFNENMKELSSDFQASVLCQLTEQNPPHTISLDVRIKMRRGPLLSHH